MPSKRDGTKSRHEKKRKSKLDEDTSEAGKKSRERRKRKHHKSKSKSGSPPAEKTAKKRKFKENDKNGAEEGKSAAVGESGGGDSLSIEETNKLRLKLGLSPLDLNETKVRDSSDEKKGNKADERVINEEGFEFVHKKAPDIADKKRQESVKEKLQTMKDKRKVYGKVLKKVKGLAKDDKKHKDDLSTSEWVEKQRQKEIEKRQAEQRAKILQEMDEEFGIDSLMEQEKSRKRVAAAKASQNTKKPQMSMTAGLRVEHSKDAFLEGQDMILVLKDKDVLAEDEEEALMNPNVADNEMHKKNVELRKRKSRYNPYEDQELDEFGNLKQPTVLGKYDEELEGEKRDTFTLDESGSVDVNKEAQTLEIKRRMAAERRQEENLDNRAKFVVASEYMTPEETLTSFKKSKKKKNRSEKGLRLRKPVKADELLSIHTVKQSDNDADYGSRNRGKGRKKAKYEEEMGECLDSDEEEKRKRPKLTVADSEDEEDLIGPEEDLTDVHVEDDAEDELAAVLDKARKLRQKAQNIKAEDSAPPDSATIVSRLIGVKDEIKMEIDENGMDDTAVVMDATSEYCRNLGEIPTYGIAGNRTDAVVDMEQVRERLAAAVEQEQPPRSPSPLQDRRKKGRRVLDHPKDEYERAMRESEQTKGVWVEASTKDQGLVQFGPSTSRRNQGLPAEDDDGFDYDEDDESGVIDHDVLGGERDVTRGVGAMLKLAAEKGYLDENRRKGRAGISLKHLDCKRFSIVEPGRYDIDDKYAKKLERMGATGSGPVRPFNEIKDYKPAIRLAYTDHLGREMDEKDAFRHLSWKFHGKGPGKKQLEKRESQVVKKELMKQMNSMDTPLGTLDKQLRKQQNLQTPYLVLSGSGRDTGAPLKKDET